MSQRLVLILIILCPAFGFAQTIGPGQPEYDRIIKEECDGPVFTKSEELPTFRISKQAFEDSLTTYLKAHQAFHANRKYTLLFVLTRQSQMLDLQKLSGAHPGTGFMKAFLESSKFWLPAKQIGRDVCSYVKCTVEIKQDRLMVSIYQ